MAKTNHALEEVSRTDLLLYEVELSDKLSVKLRETTGLDETIVLRHLGDKFKSNGYGAMLYRNGMIGRAVKEVRDARQREDAEFVVLQPTNAEGFINSLSSKEKAALEIAYSELNDLTDDARDKVKNALTPTMTM